MNQDSEFGIEFEDVMEEYIRSLSFGIRRRIDTLPLAQSSSVRLSGSLMSLSAPYSKSVEIS